MKVKSRSRRKFELELRHYGYSKWKTTGTHLHPKRPSVPAQRRGLESEFLGARRYGRAKVADDIVRDSPVVLVHNLDMEVCIRRYVLDLPIFVPYRAERVHLHRRPTKAQTTSHTFETRQKGDGNAHIFNVVVQLGDKVGVCSTDDVHFGDPRGPDKVEGDVDVLCLYPMILGPLVYAASDFGLGVVHGSTDLAKNM